MDYANYTLVGLGFGGIVAKVLVKIVNLNRRPDANFSLGSFILLEIPTILLSCIVVIIAVVIKDEVKQLKYTGNYIGLFYTAVGYTALDIAMLLGGRADKMVNKIEEEKTELIKKGSDSE